MSTSPRLTKRELRDVKRAERESAEAAARAATARRRTLTRLGGAVALAAAIVAILIVVSSQGGKTTPPPSTPAQASTAATEAANVFSGFTEKDGVVGSATAKVTVTEFVDLQCPICAETSAQILPGVVNDYVRTGKIKLQARTLHFIGSDSTKAAKVAAGAQAQGHFWPFLEAFYADQGAENSGYVTDAFLRNVAKASGVDATKALAYANTSAAKAKLAAADSQAGTLGINATPTFVVESANGTKKVVDASGVQTAIKDALRS